jgi:hypothetical protein
MLLIASRDYSQAARPYSPPNEATVYLVDTPGLKHFPIKQTITRVFLSNKDGNHNVSRGRQDKRWVQAKTRTD